MTPDGIHSFDRPRERPAPTVLHGKWLHGESASIELTSLTLVAAVKANCDGCTSFVHSALEELAGFDVIVVSATDLDDGEWSGARRKVLVSPDAFTSLEIRWPPVYVVIDPATAMVVGEGVIFSPSQVAKEVERFLDR